jgi:PKD repeat protein
MKLKYNLIFVTLLICSFIQYSCEDNESGIDLIELEARFVTDINDRTITFNNISTGASSFLWNFGDGTTSEAVNPQKTYQDYGTYTVTLTATSDNGETSIFQDDLSLELDLTPVPIVNGDFENGSEGWIQGVDDNVPAPVVTEGGNSYYEVNVTSPDPSQPFLVNLSQKLEIVQGNTYLLRFDAWSDGNRSIIAGIGLSGGDFTNNVQIVEITDTQTQYELTLNSFDFGAPDARILFDSNAEAGFVRIDNVSLFIQE